MSDNIYKTLINKWNFDEIVSKKMVKKIVECDLKVNTKLLYLKYILNSDYFEMKDDECQEYLEDSIRGFDLEIKKKKKLGPDGGDVVDMDVLQEIYDTTDSITMSVIIGIILYVPKFISFKNIFDIVHVMDLNESYGKDLFYYIENENSFKFNYLIYPVNDGGFLKKIKKMLKLNIENEEEFIERKGKFIMLNCLAYATKKFVELYGEDFSVKKLNTTTKYLNKKRLPNY